MIFPKNSFLAILVAILNFCNKTNLSLGKGARLNDFDEIFDPRVSSNLLIFPIIVFPPFLVAIMNFCVDFRFISETR